MFSKVKLCACQGIDVVKIKFRVIEKAAVAAAAHVPSDGQLSLHPHPTTTPLPWQGSQNILSNNHPDFTHRNITTTSKYI